MKAGREEPRDEAGGGAKTWAVVVGLGLAILAWGFFLFFSIGDKGPLPWDFGVIDDLPGSSPYATHGPRQSPTLGPQAEAPGPAPQHVGGKEAK